MVQARCRKFEVGDDERKDLLQPSDDKEIDGCPGVSIR